MFSVCLGKLGDQEVLFNCANVKMEADMMTFFIANTSV